MSQKRIATFKKEEDLIDYLESYKPSTIGLWYSRCDNNFHPTVSITTGLGESLILKCTMTRVQFDPWLGQIQSSTRSTVVLYEGSLEFAE